MDPWEPFTPYSTDWINKPPLDSKYIKQLDESGIDPNKKYGSYVYSFNEYASSTGRLNLAKYLMESGAAIRLIDRTGHVSLYRATWASQDDKIGGISDTVTYLIEHTDNANVLLFSFIV